MQNGKDKPKTRPVSSRGYFLLFTFYFSLSLGLLFLSCAYTLPEAASPGGYITNGKRYLADRDYELAIRNFEQSAALESRNPEAFWLMGRTYLLMGDTVRTLPLLRQCLILDADYPGALSLLGDLYLALGRGDSALAFYDRIAPEDSSYPAIQYRLGEMCFAAGDLTRAEKHYQKAAMAGSGWVGPYLRLAALYFGAGRTRDTEEAARTALRMGDAGESLYWLGRLALQKDQWPDAALLFLRSQAGDPKSPHRAEIAELFNTRGDPFKGEPTSKEPKVTFILERHETVNVAVYDRTGKLVKSLFISALGKGNYGMDWDGKYTNGDTAPAGIYIGNVMAETFQRTMTFRAPFETRK